jgi:hypothetical protein
LKKIRIVGNSGSKQLRGRVEWRGEGLQMSIRESPLALMLTALYRQRQFTYGSLVGVNFTSYYTNPHYASSRRSLAHTHMGFPQQ